LVPARSIIRFWAEISTCAFRICTCRSGCSTSFSTLAVSNWHAMRHADPIRFLSFLAAEPGSQRSRSAALVRMHQVARRAFAALAEIGKGNADDILSQMRLSCTRHVCNLAVDLKALATSLTRVWKNVSVFLEIVAIGCGRSHTRCGERTDRRCNYGATQHRGSPEKDRGRTAKCLPRDIDLIVTDAVTLLMPPR
jgi:hypothetical protein